MKVEQKNKEFNPITITIETQKERDYLFGLVSAGSQNRKRECDGYSDVTDNSVFQAFKKFSREASE